MPEPYIEVEIRAGKGFTEELAGMLAQLGVEGFWEDGAVLKCYVRQSRWSKALAGELERVVRLMVKVSSTPLPPITYRVLEDRNWNAEWEATITPIRISNRIIITPTWHTVTPLPGEIILTIDPKMSFGTGYHETTRLMLRLLERWTRPGMSVLDVGTGTGVLAIAAVRLGAASAIGVDTDEWASMNAGENVRLNKVASQVSILAGDIHAVPKNPFNIVAANIQRSIIEPILHDMIARLAPGGTLLLSGLLLDDRTPITGSLVDCAMTVCEELQENEWLALAARRARKSEPG